MESAVGTTAGSIQEIDWMKVRRVITEGGEEVGGSQSQASWAIVDGVQAGISLTYDIDRIYVRIFESSYVGDLLYLAISGITHESIEYLGAT